MERFVFNGATMGSRYSVTFYADAMPRDLERDCQHAISEIDQIMTTYSQNSDLMRLNHAEVGKWINVPHQLIDILDIAKSVEVYSEGAFNIAVGGWVAAWGFGARCSANPDKIAEGLKNGGDFRLSSFETGEGRARRLSDVSLDLSGIAKGYGVDVLCNTLNQYGIKNGLVSIDGELRALGEMPARRGWPIAIEAPFFDRREIHSVLEIEDMAVATSGDYRHYLDTEFGRFSHNFDPKKARPVKNDLASVSVLAPSCVLADAWATALFVLGKDAGMALCERHKIDALFIYRGEGGEIQTLSSGEIFAP